VWLQLFFKGKKTQNYVLYQFTHIGQSLGLYSIGAVSSIWCTLNLKQYAYVQ